MKRLPTNPFKANIFPLTFGSHNLEIVAIQHIKEQPRIPKTVTKPRSKYILTLFSFESKLFFKSKTIMIYEIIIIELTIRPNL